MTHVGSSTFRNLIDVPPLDFTDGNGSKDLSLFVNGDGVDSLILDPTLDLLALGFFSSSAAGSEGVIASFVDNTGTVVSSVALTNSVDSFLGIIMSGGMSLSHVNFNAASVISGGTGEGFRIDNVSGVVVPEPTSGIIWGLALVGVVAYRRRQRRGIA